MSFLLGSDTAWTSERQWATWNSDKTVRIKPGEKWPVHLVYMTAWVDDAGQINFYKDIYNKDQQLVASLATN